MNAKTMKARGLGAILVALGLILMTPLAGAEKQVALDTVESDTLIAANGPVALTTEPLIGVCVFENDPKPSGCATGSHTAGPPGFIACSLVGSVVMGEGSVTCELSGYPDGPLIFTCEKPILVAIAPNGCVADGNFPAVGDTFFHECISSGPGGSTGIVVCAVIHT